MFLSSQVGTRKQWGSSINGGTSKWMLLMESPFKNGWFGGIYPYFILFMETSIFARCCKEALTVLKRKWWSSGQCLLPSPEMCKIFSYVRNLQYHKSLDIHSICDGIPKETKHSREAHSNDTSFASFSSQRNKLRSLLMTSSKRMLHYLDVFSTSKKTEQWFTTILMGFCFYLSIFLGLPKVNKQRISLAHPQGPRTWITFCPRASDALYSKTSNTSRK